MRGHPLAAALVCARLPGCAFIPVAPWELNYKLFPPSVTNVHFLGWPHGQPPAVCSLYKLLTPHKRAAVACTPMSQHCQSRSDLAGTECC